MYLIHLVQAFKNCSFEYSVHRRYDRFKIYTDGENAGCNDIFIVHIITAEAPEQSQQYAEVSEIG